MRTLFLMIALSLLLVLGCIESNPQPSPLSKDSEGGSKWEPGDDAVADPQSPVGVDDELIYASAAGSDNGIIVVGEAGAAPDAQGGFAEEPSSDNGEDGDGDFSVNTDGSFVVVVPKIDPPKIKLVFKYPDADDIVVEIPVPGSADLDDASSPWVDSGEGEPANGPPAEFDGFEQGAGASYGIKAVAQEDGLVEVVGGFLSVTPLAKVVVANLATGETAVDQANNIGEFVVTLAGLAGDDISIFAVNPQDKEKATEAILLSAE